MQLARNKNAQIIQRAVWASIGGERERDREREWREWRERSWEREGGKRGRGRQLPPTPTKPSTLHVKQQPFSRISHSPSHVSKSPKYNIQKYIYSYITLTQLVYVKNHFLVFQGLKVG